MSIVEGFRLPEGMELQSETDSELTYPKTGDLLNSLTVVSNAEYNHPLFDRHTFSYPNSQGKKDILMIEPTPLYSGTYGSIYKIFDELKGILAVKVFKDQKTGRWIKKEKKEEIDEYDLFSELYRVEGGDLCNTIGIIPHILNDIPVIVMPLFDGDLSELIFKLDENDSEYKNSETHYENTILIALHIAKAFKCLYEREPSMSYTDIKSQNIMYKIGDDKQLEVLLGDLGGICWRGSMMFATPIMTYPPLATYVNMTLPGCDQTAMVYGLGILLLELLNIDLIVFLGWENLGSLINDYREAGADLSKLYIEILTEIETEISNITNAEIITIIMTCLKNEMDLDGIITLLEEELSFLTEPAEGGEIRKKRKKKRSKEKRSRKKKKRSKKKRSKRYKIR